MRPYRTQDVLTLLPRHSDHGQNLLRRPGLLQQRLDQVRFRGPSPTGREPYRLQAGKHRLESTRFRQRVAQGVPSRSPISAFPPSPGRRRRVRGGRTTAAAEEPASSGSQRQVWRPDRPASQPCRLAPAAERRGPHRAIVRLLSTERHRHPPLATAQTTSIANTTGHCFR